MKSLYAAAAIVGAAAAMPASAGPVTPLIYQLNEIVGGQIAGGNGVQATSGFGTVTYADDATHANLVDVTIALTAGFKALEITMNTDAAVLGGTLTAGPGITVSANHVSADGYKGSFDIAVPNNGNLGNSNPVTFTLSLNGGATNIDPSDFNFLDTLGLVYNVVHVGSCSTNAACSANDGSLWVGSGLGATPVPEPISLALLGAGLIGLGVVRNKRPI